MTGVKCAPQEEASKFYETIWRFANLRRWHGQCLTPEHMFRVSSACKFLIPSLCLMGALRAATVPEHVYYHDLPTEVPFLEKEENALDAGIKRLKQEMLAEGIHPFFSYWGDFLANPVGGLDQKASWMQLLVTGVEIDMEKRVGWKGGFLVASITDAAGSNLSIPVGNVFTLSQAYVMNSFALYNLYVKQELFDGKLDLRVGRMSAGQFFATLPAMGMVVSGAVNGNPTSLFLNAPYHATASASWAAYTKYKPSDAAYVEAGVFQASPRIGNPVYHGADFSIRPGDGVLIMMEAGWTPVFGKETSSDGKTTSPAPGLAGVYSFGAYYANYTFSRFSGGTEYNAFGFYAVAQQMVWRSPSNPNQNISLWGGITYSPQLEISQMPVMGFGGIIWQGCIPTRDKDSALLSFYTGGFSPSYARAQARDGNGYATNETVLEASYLIQLTEALQLQPDLQWVIQPGGTGNIPNALVLGFQVGVIF